MRALGVVVVLGVAAACSPSGSDPSSAPPARVVDDASSPVFPEDAGSEGGTFDAAPPPPPPSPTDGIRNGLETDVDCGGPGPTTPRCLPHRACLDGLDCTTGLCGTSGPAARRCLSSRSCAGSAGTWSCGLLGDEDCCTALPVPGGSYQRFSDPAFPATVSPFKLDMYEVTVGRLRSFFEATAGNPRAFAPAPGAGAHPKVMGSGWRSSFDVRLPASSVEIDERLGAVGCTKGGDNSDGGAATWTHAPGPYEGLPITCIDWYTLFAFCAWDGGRLPTDAEWGFAAQGGSEQRQYAWSQPGSAPTQLLWGVHDAIVAGSLWDPANQVYKFSVGSPFRLTDPVTGKVTDGPSHMTVPGTKTGHGRWGHADLTGNVLEYLLDVTPTPQGACVDCARVDFPDPPQDQVGWYPSAWMVGADFPDGDRSLRGGSWDPTHPPQTAFQYDYVIARTYYAAGGRCARD